MMPSDPALSAMSAWTTACLWLCQDDIMGNARGPGRRWSADESAGAGRRLLSCVQHVPVSRILSGPRSAVDSSAAAQRASPPSLSPEGRWSRQGSVLFRSARRLCSGLSNLPVKSLPRAPDLPLCCSTHFTYCGPVPPCPP